MRYRCVFFCSFSYSAAVVQCFHSAQPHFAGLQSPHSSPRSPPPPQTSCASRMVDNNSSSGGRQGDSVVASRSPPFPGESGISLQDISSLLSGGHYLPPGFSASMHGVTHSGGLVVQTRHGGEHHSQPPHHPHHGPQGTMRHSSSSPPSSSSEAQAVLIRPPQQLSRPASSSHDDLGLISASDLSRNDLSLLSQRDLHWSEQLSQQDGRGGEHEVGRGGDGQRQQNCGSDRGLELRDLDVGLQAGLLMVNGGVVVGGHRPEVMGATVAGESCDLHHVPCGGEVRQAQ